MPFPFRGLILGLLLLGLASVAPPPAGAQVTATVADYDSTQLRDNSTQLRDQLYSELEREVAEYDRFSGIVKKVVRLVTPTVVHIDSIKNIARSQRGASAIEEAGSGVIIRVDRQHFVLTNRHVVQDTPLSQLHLRLHDGRLLTPEAVLADRGTDVALIRVLEDDLTAARLGDSDLVEIGESVLAVGSPFGLSHSVTSGIISAKGRRQLELGSDSVRLQDFLQTDAAINPGNSGGPLLNLRGEVIGINTAIASNSGGSEGIGFAIPINMAVYVARQLVQQGRVTHAYLGVRLENGYGPEMARQLGIPYSQGALVKGITPRSPADLAQVQPNDLITGFDNVHVEDDVHLVNLVSLTPIGKIVTLRILRDGQPTTVRVKVGDRSQFESEPY